MDRKEKDGLEYDVIDELLLFTFLVLIRFGFFLVDLVLLGF